MPKVPVALQMYTLRELARTDFAGTVRAVAQIGYAGVELAGYGGLSGTQLRHLLDAVGLAVAGDHVSLDRLETALPEVIELEHALGNRFVVVPSIPEALRRDVAGYLSVAESLNRIGSRLQEEGLQLCYHNHAFEFEAFDGKFALDWLYELTDPELVKAELDTYWVQYAGQDPAAYIRKYAHRLGLLHLKDMEPGDERMFAEVGEGILNWPAIFQAADASTARWYIVEQDRSRRSSIESARLSFENLKKMGKA